MCVVRSRLKIISPQFLQPVLFHGFEVAPAKIIFQAFSRRNQTQTRISPINTNSICRSGVLAARRKLISFYYFFNSNPRISFPNCSSRMRVSPSSSPAKIHVGYQCIHCCAAVSAGMVGFQPGLVCCQRQSDSACGLTHPDSNDTRNSAAIKTTVWICFIAMGCGRPFL